MRSSLQIDKETLELNPELKMPSFSTQACTCSSNIGRVKGNLPSFSICMDINKETIKNDYIVCFDSIYTGNDLIIMALRPNFINKKYYQMIIDEMNNIFNL